MASDMEWAKDLQMWLYRNIIPNVTNNRQLQIQFVNAAPMAVFIRAFTHETISSDNYEKLEVLGDKILATNLTQIIMTRFPQLDPMGISNMVSHYSADSYQSDFMRKINADSRIRVGELVKSMGVNVLGDVFESLFGAIYQVADSIKPGSGMMACYNLCSYFYNTITLDLEMSLGNPKTIVQQLFNRFTDGIVPKQENVGTQDNPEIVVTLVQENIDSLNRHGIHNFQVGQEIGRGKAAKLSEAVTQAYSQARKLLQSQGVNNQWVENAKNAEDVRSSELSPLWESVRAKLLSQGFNSFTFRVSRKMSTSNKRVILLIGIKSNGEETILESASGNNQTILTKKKLFTNYLRS